MKNKVAAKKLLNNMPAHAKNSRAVGLYILNVETFTNAEVAKACKLNTAQAKSAKDYLKKLGFLTVRIGSCVEGKARYKLDDICIATHDSMTATPRSTSEERINAALARMKKGSAANKVVIALLLNKKQGLTDAQLSKASGVKNVAKKIHALRYYGFVIKNRITENWESRRFLVDFGATQNIECDLDSFDISQCDLHPAHKLFNTITEK